MAVPAVKLRMTYAEYLAREEASEEKHEFVDGEVFGMSGGTPRHARLQVRFGARLEVALDGRRCAPYGPDLRICFPEGDRSAYADCVVVCGPVVAAPEDPHAATNPTVVVEVLSPSTEAYDRGDKFARYRTLPSLKEYVLVAQDRPLVEVFSRQPDESWTLRVYGPGTTAALASLEVGIAVDALYAGVFEEPPA